MAGNHWKFSEKMHFSVQIFYHSCSVMVDKSSRYIYLINLISPTEHFREIVLKYREHAKQHHQCNCARTALKEEEKQTMG